MKKTKGLAEDTIIPFSVKGKIISRHRLIKDGRLIVSPDKRIKVKKIVMQIIEELLKRDYHIVMQTSEGPSYKIVNATGWAKCVLFVKSKNIQTFNLKGNRDLVKKLLALIGIKDEYVNIRNNNKSKYTYTDFDYDCKYKDIVNFIEALPVSSQCGCGHKNDKSGSGKKIVIKKKSGRKNADGRPDTKG